jgi:YggT family protein
MSILATILIGLAQVITLVLQLYSYVVIASAIVSWVNADPSNPIVRTIRMLTEPVFAWVRRKLPRSFFRSGLDLSPVIVLLVLMFLRYVVGAVLIDIALRLRASPIVH